MNTITTLSRRDAYLVAWALAVSFVALFNPLIPRLGVICIMATAIVVIVGWRMYPQRLDASIALALVALVAVSVPYGLFVAVPAALVYGVVALVRRR